MRRYIMKYSSNITTSKIISKMFMYFVRDILLACYLNLNDRALNEFVILFSARKKSQTQLDNIKSIKPINCGMFE